MRGGRSVIVTRSYIHIRCAKRGAREDRTARTVAIKLGLGVAASGVFLKAVVYHLPQEPNFVQPQG